MRKRRGVRALRLLVFISMEEGRKKGGGREEEKGGSCGLLLRIGK